MRRVLLFVAMSMTGLACGGGGSGNGSPTPTPTATLTPTPTPTPSVCSTSRSTLIHAIAADGKLYSFDPALVGSADPFALVGTPACAPGPALSPFPSPATPYALAVDDTDTAWVLYTSGEIFRVSTLDASCSATTFAPQQMTGATTWSLFGMAFVSDTAGLAAERIWISGGGTDGSRGDLGSVTTSSFVIADVGALGGTNPQRPDLMGVSDATLWGFFPGNSNGFVQQIEKTTGALSGTPKSVSYPAGTVQAWGAAQWGGKFWIFVTTDNAAVLNSTVQTIDRGTGADTLLLQNLVPTIVAAASSTCAPP